MNYGFYNFQTNLEETNKLYKQNINTIKKDNRNIPFHYESNDNKIENNMNNDWQNQSYNNIYHSIKFKGRNIKQEEVKNHEYPFKGEEFGYNKEINNKNLFLINKKSRNDKIKNNTLLLNSRSPKNFIPNKYQLINVVNSQFQHNISPIKNNKPLNSERKQNRYKLNEWKNNITIKKIDINGFDKTINNDNNNNIPIIPKNDVCIENFENFIIKKNNINIIQIPKKLNPLNTEIKKNLFNEDNKHRLNNFYSPQRKKFLNIDINMDYSNERTICLKQNFSSLFNDEFNKSLLTENKKNNFRNISPINSPLKNASNQTIQIKKVKNIDSKNFKIIWSGKSQPGKDKKGNFKINQDAFKVYENINNIKNFNMYILCDGHGKDGHYVSKYITDNLSSIISSHSSISSLKNTKDIYQTIIKNDHQIIKDIFSRIDISLSLQKYFDTETSGCTCVLIMQIGSKIICGNIGDSRAILIYSNSPNLSNTKVFPLSIDSKPDLPSELNRIKKFGGEVHKKRNNNGKYVGAMRVYAKGKDYPGLAMSRSFGDFESKRYGVICEPSFVEYDLDENCKYLVVCSDGVWDFLDNEKVAKIGNKYYLNNNPERFCIEILENAAYWWEKEDNIIDDITALIIFFKFYS